MGIVLVLYIYIMSIMFYVHLTSLTLSLSLSLSLSLPLPSGYTTLLACWCVYMLLLYNNIIMTCTFTVKSALVRMRVQCVKMIYMKAWLDAHACGSQLACF